MLLYSDSHPIRSIDRAYNYRPAARHVPGAQSESSECQTSDLVMSNGELAGGK
jgi:hypothetical protein